MIWTFSINGQGKEVYMDIYSNDRNLVKTEGENEETKEEMRVRVQASIWCCIN